MGQPKSRRQEKGSEGPKAKKLPEALDFGLLFCLVYPPAMLFLVSTGIWESKLVGGKAMTALAEGSFSVTLDIVMITIGTACLLIGPLLAYVAKRYMEDK
jgi:hypothetical protein